MNAAEKLADPGFGNYMLNGLREITLPAAPSYRPQTIGWQVLAVVGLILLVLWSLQCYRIWQKNGYRRDALKQLKELEQRSQRSGHRGETLQELPVLLKQTALAVYPREQVAQLSGASWLSFLDATYGGDRFTQGEGRLVSQLSYQSAEAIGPIPAATLAELITTVRTWIITHQAPDRGGHETTPTE